MYSVPTQNFDNSEADSLATSSAPGWEQGNFVLNELIQGQMDFSIRASDPLPTESANQNLKTISPIGINLHISPESRTATSGSILNMLLADLRESLPHWHNRPLGDLYWNRQLIEHLDEGGLTELAYHLASKLKKSHSHYQHTAELSVNEESLANIALIKGLGVTRLVFSLPIMCQQDPQLTSKLIRTVAQAQDLGYDTICIRLTYDCQKIGARELMGLFLDLPELGPHELMLNPLQKQGGKFQSLWGNPEMLHGYDNLMTRLRNWLASQGYRPLGYDRFTLGDQPHNLSRYVFFGPMGQLNGSSPDFVGIGPGAFSRLGQYTAENHKDFGIYSGLVSRGMHPRQQCARLNNGFLALEHQLIQLLQELRIDLKEIEQQLGKEHIIKLRSDVEGLPKDVWEIDSSKQLILADTARDWLPTLCQWLINTQPFDHHTSGSR